MHPILRNALVLIGGIIVGSIVNMGLIKIGHALIPPPVGLNMNTMEGVKEAMTMFTTKDFIFPFLAHALGTLTGAYFVARLAASHQLRLALTVGVFFLLGGISMVTQLSAPLWFNVLDLVGAYIPMAWLGGRMAGRSFSH
jgi:uncharacterized membrane protein YqgA involved in biofilm formation